MVTCVAKSKNFILGRCFMQPIQEELIVKEEKKYFVCIFLDDDKQCLVEKKECPQDKKEKCKQVEDLFQ